MTRSRLAYICRLTTLSQRTLSNALGLILLAACALPLAAGPCLPYEPAAVTLSGTLTSREQPRTWWALELNRPVCVGEDADRHAQAGVAEIHLLFPKPEDFTRYQRLMGEKVNVTGTLSPRIMSHHHTPVIMTAEEVSDASKYRLTRSRKNKSAMSYGPPAYTAEINFNPLSGRIETRAWLGSQSAELKPADSYVEHFFEGAADVLWAACKEGYSAAAASSSTRSRIVSRDQTGTGSTLHGVVLGHKGESNITLRCQDPAKQQVTKPSLPPDPVSLLSGSVVVQPTRIWYKTFLVTATGRITGHFQASGGLGDDIEVMIGTQVACAAWIRGQSTQALYSSGRVRSGQIDVRVPYAGSYCLAFNNGFSLVSAKHVSAEITLGYPVVGLD